MSLAGIDVTYGRGPDAVAALRDVSFEVPSGGCLAILGPSGCGKTTLLRVVAGLERPAAGMLRIDGIDAAGIVPQRRGVGFVFASDALFPHLSARRNVAYGVRSSSRAELRRAVDAAAERCRIGHLLERAPRELSSGERQRVALARALASEPRVLLLDEPLSRLDAPLRLELRREIARIRRESGLTTLVVTHAQDEALALGDRVAVLRDGRIEQVGRPRTLVDTPANAFVGGFVGSPPMAFVPAARFAPDAPAGSVLGVRAPDVRLSATGRFRGIVRSVEDGAERAIAELDVGDGTLSAAIPAGDRLPSPGETVAFDVALERRTLFDASGARLPSAVRV